MNYGKRKKIARDLLIIAGDIVGAISYKEYLKQHPNSKYKNERAYNKAMGIGISKSNKGISISPKKENISKEIVDKTLDGLNKSSETKLVNQAKKYKSPDDFAKSYGKKLYHGTSFNRNFDEFDVSHANTGVGSNAFSQGNEGVYFTDSLNSARYFSRKANEKHHLTKHNNNPDATMEDRMKAMDDAWESMYGDNADKNENIVETFLSSDAKIKHVDKYPNKKDIQDLKKSGYDGVSFEEEGIKDAQDIPEHLQEKKPSNTTFVWNTDKVKTKRQLDNIWKKAVG